MKPDDINILELLPQRPPFVMVDRLTYFCPETTRTELAVKSDNLFAADGRLSSYGMIENIAQTCAARMGYMSRLGGQSVKLGFIGAIRDLKINRQPAVGETIATEIRVREEVFGMTLVDASITVGEETLAAAEMKIALTDIDSKGGEQA